MFPRPTAKPMDARMNSDLCPQLSRVDFTAAPSSAFSITAETDVDKNSHYRDGTSFKKMIVDTKYSFSYCFRPYQKSHLHIVYYHATLKPF